MLMKINKDIFGIIAESVKQCSNIKRCGIKDFSAYDAKLIKYGFWKSNWKF